MTPADRVMLKGIREAVEKLASELKRANDLGYQVAFNVDNIKGVVENFSVKQMMPIDLDQELH